MQLIRGLSHFPEAMKGCVVTIGSFDGVHLGHQAVIDQLKRHAASLQAPSIVMSFEPQPKDYFQPDKALPRITRLREKIHGLKQAGADAFLLLRFNQALATLSAEEFVLQVLVKTLAVQHVVIGDDFRFGKGRQGDFELLSAMGKHHGFAVSRTVSHQLAGERVSSTRIREALATGELGQAKQLLGRPFTMEGRIAPGHQNGRTIGYPTANIHLFRAKSPVHGVFVVEMTGIDESPLPGVASIGHRPILPDDDRWVLEVHLFDFNRDIYGRCVTVHFLHKLREEVPFDDFDALQQQIDKDAADARAFLLHTKR